MIDFFEWAKTAPLNGRTWLVAGKGPTFDRHPEIADLDAKYAILGLNHVCRNKKVFVAHMIDANVLDEIEDLPSKIDYLLMPWQPHFKFRPTPTTLAMVLEKSPVLQQIDRKQRLLWYNLSTGNAPNGDSPRVLVDYFSAEAAVRLLAMAGVKVIRTLGIDGGNTYAGTFKDIPPFRGGHTTFDHQTAKIKKTVDLFKLDYKPLFDPPSVKA